jgi:NAD(P)-dependent dehydrogenase (short-subunit alcohol dehydrogenase family)
MLYYVLFLGKVVMSNFFDLTGKTALITGASSGLGEQFARCLSASGARVILVARRFDKLQALANELGNAIALEMDVTDKKVVQAIVAKLGKSDECIDICVNAAGVAKTSYIFEPDDDSFENIQKVNFIGAWNVIKAVANHMKKYTIQGSIINLGSVSGDALPARGGAGYCSSKAAVHQLTKTLVGELSAHNIRINTLSTWMIPTAMTQEFLEENEEQIVEITPLGLAKINDLDAAILFLASNQASRYMTGSCLTVDGGVSWGGKT